MNHDQTKAEGQALLPQSTTSFDTLEKAGWKIESNGFTTSFRHTSFRHTSGAIMPVPFWVIQWLTLDRAQAIEETRREIRQALGIEEKQEVRAVA